jgi:uncharacterized protein
MNFKSSAPEINNSYIYTIPFQDKFIVYRPLKPLAFVANRAMVNFISSLVNGGLAAEAVRHEEAYGFLERIGFFVPDPPPPERLTSDAPFNPTIAVLFTTTACNFRCIYCYASGGENKVKTLPFEIGRSAIDEVCRNASKIGEDHFTVGFHGGGEPTLAKETFNKLVNYAKGKDLRCELTVATNGYWTDGERDWILDNLTSISLSLDGNSKVHDRQRPLASGQATHENIMKTVREMDRRGFPYGIRLTVTDESIASLPESIDFLCRETACKTFQVEPAFDHGRAQRDGTALSQDDSFAAAFMEAYDIAASSGSHLYYSGARPWVVTPCFCQALDKALIVAPDGLVTSCYEVYSSKHRLAGDFFFGSLSEKGNLVVDHEVRKALRAKIEERRISCRGCFCYWHCAGDCPSKTLTPGKDGHLRFGRRCDLNRRITEKLLAHYISDAGGVWHGHSHPISEC